MYLASGVIRTAIDELQKSTHPFVGITFLACKAAKFPISSTVELSLDRATRNHLDKFHRLDPQSEFYFQPFKSNKMWVVSKYPSAGLQAINTQTFGRAFLHPKGSRTWGFDSSYLSSIRDVLDNDKVHDLTPINSLAIWVGKDEYWEAGTEIDDVVRWFRSEFFITDKELSTLFVDDRSLFDNKVLISADKPDLKLIAFSFQLPPDAPSETEGTLSSLKLRHIGPADAFDLDFGERLTLIAGDNGLGKSFLLEAAWWAITGAWVNEPAFPLGQRDGVTPRIEYTIREAAGHELSGVGKFENVNRKWVTGPDQPSVAAICLYGKANGSFAAYDPIRTRFGGWNNEVAAHFESEDVWYGKGSQTNGLLRDWANWQRDEVRRQSEDEISEFEMLVRILDVLSPEDLGPILPSDIIRIPNESREVPTISHSYGDVPITMASAGVKRILALAYMIIWSWSEHKLFAKQTGTPQLNRMVIVVDEIEAHLHPKWQRTILPALILLGRQLSEGLDVQVIAATHSPMVMASVESEFSDEADTLFHLALQDGSIILEELEFQKYGDVSAWLTSPIFGLKQARSRSAEKIIERAKAVQLSQRPSQSEISQVSSELKRQLAPDDPFWSRWTFFAESHGVQL